MGLFNKLSGSKRAVLDERVREIRQALIKKAKSQSEEHVVNVILEAKKIGEMSGILKDGTL